ncbi:conserved repeat domain-containing protein/Por secretion system C-terminal sorting domain-containing protein [Tangfeifania diversioriginum]|uniref:Conserved repeat domain-containing protein/Por secretion system C-terminal sorting domain-containing protein n=1 Tax=Tangfeifania diversioriginum TaxID=1168035 RepID=A0A1M6EUC2_9BACT|nr:T9SS type A sorting domain-containing protein [Tangfeifania diversioriginum]SHI89008.1 conserved repeat domain-containing protein/Por secretion system C-terminal sorting domain-containing protein [Tangfeifania diversioriginum]
MKNFYFSQLFNSKSICKKIKKNEKAERELHNSGFSVHSANKLKLLFSGFFALLLILFGSADVNAQTGNPNEAEWNGQGGYSLKKIVSNTSIQSGVNFSYTIMFSAPAGATDVFIQDDVPASLEVVSVAPVSNVNGVTPSVNISGQTVTYSLSSLPSGSASSGSFTIVVKFPEGVTCDGTSVRNQAGIRINDKMYNTPHVSTTATAEDPWRVTKSIVSGAIVNPNGGSCGYLMGAGDTVTYRLSVLKNSPFYGNVTGQQNMNNAVVTDVLPAGAVFVSSSCGATASGNTFTWQPNGGTLNAATPYAYYYCDITVYYPAATFPNGTQITNDATLDGDMCNAQVSHVSNETCIEVATIQPNPDAYFQKFIYMTNRVPGCDGYYRIAFKNNGNVSLSAFDIDDAIPSGITVNSVRVFGGSATTSMSLTANSGNDVINSSIVSNFYNSGPLSITVNDLQWKMTGSLPVDNWINLYIYFTVDANPPGTVIENCASFDGLSNNLTLDDACVSFTVGEGEPKPCILKEVCSPEDSYEPGDILRFRMRVQNIGSADISGAFIQDALHSNFSYVGNETYYVASNYNPDCSGSGNLPSGATAWTGVTPNHSGNNLEWQLPDIASDCQLFYVGYCGYYGTWTLPYHYIEFDVMVDSMAMPGVTPNKYEISGGNLVSAVTSNTANVLVVANFGQEVEKQVSSDNGNNFASSATVGAGGTARYRLNYKNTSNVPVTSVSLVDLLAMNDGANDWLILNRNTSRGSQFGVGYVNSGTHTTSLSPSGTSPSASFSYAAGQNICLPDFGLNAGCTTSGWAGGSSGQNIRMDYGTFALAPGVTLREDFDVTVPADATLQETSCNDFAAISTANFLLDGTAQSVALTPIAAPPVCITADSLQVSECCENVKVEVFQDPDLGECCAQFVSECETDSVVVNITNGTFTSATLNGNSLSSGFAGQSSFTFDTNSTSADLITCVTPDSTGVVVVSYVAYFANGEKCEKRVEMDCEATTSECCESVTVDIFQDPDLAGECCAQFVSKCETDSVVVNIHNGIFATATLNGTSLSSGFAGQSSFTFDTNSTSADLITCVTPDSTGVVVVSYVAYFANGEKCERRVEMDCEAAEPTSDCCPVIDFKLRRSWPYFSKYVGTFEIINPDPSNPICSVEISSSPAGNFNTGTLTIDGTASGQSWNSTSIPASGTLSPQAVNNMLFTLTAFNYKGKITVCVTKCDGTECCYEFNWNGKPIVVSPWDPVQVGVESKLVAVSVSPEMAEQLDESIKYVSFGFADEEDLNGDAEFFAIGGTGDCDDGDPGVTPGAIDPDSDDDGISDGTESYMSRHNAFFELTCPYRPGSGQAPTFNLVLKGGLPQLGMALISEEGNVVFDGEIDLANPDSVISSVEIPGEKSASMFEFINLYPNPSDGSFRVTYATGNQQDVEIRLVNPLGQIIKVLNPKDNFPGVHNTDIDVRDLAGGVYRVFLYSEGKVRSKSVVIDR